MTITPVTTTISVQELCALEKEPSDNAFKFPCTKCAACCKNISHLKAILPVKEDGSCEHLVNNQCSVYNNRPLICNIQKLAEKSQIPIKKFYKQNAIACNKMIEELGLDERFLINIEQLNPII